MDGPFFVYHSSMGMVSVQDAQDGRECRRDITITEAQILVVDDEVGMVTLLRNYLTREGYAVTTAPSAEVALQLLEEHDIADLNLEFVHAPTMRQGRVAARDASASISVWNLCG